MPLDIFKLIVRDLATTQVVKLVKTAAQVHSSALASAGYHLMRRAKEGIQRRAPGGEAWPELHPWSRYKVLPQVHLARARAKLGMRAARSSSIKTDTKAWPKMSRAVKYKRETSGDSIRVRVGFLSGWIQKAAARMAEGQTVQITAKMRRAFFAHGIPLTGSTLHFPPRPHMAPVFRQNQARVVSFCRQRINAAIAGQDPKSIQF